MLLLVLTLSALASTATSRPKYIHCVDSSECGSWECCVLGGGRFSLPRCVPMADVGDPCRPGVSKPVNTSVLYPDGQWVQLPAVFLHLCPCVAGLECSVEAGPAGDGVAGPTAPPVCRDPVVERDVETNALPGAADIALVNNF